MIFTSHDRTHVFEPLYFLLLKYKHLKFSFVPLNIWSMGIYIMLNLKTYAYKYKFRNYGEQYNSICVHCIRIIIRTFVGNPFSKIGYLKLYKYGDFTFYKIHTIYYICIECELCGKFGFCFGILNSVSSVVTASTIFIILF